MARGFILRSISRNLILLSEAASRRAFSYSTTSLDHIPNFYSLSVDGVSSNGSHYAFVFILFSVSFFFFFFRFAKVNGDAFIQ